MLREHPKASAISRMEDSNQENTVDSGESVDDKLLVGNVRGSLGG